MRNYRRLPRSAFQPLRIRAALQCGVAGDFTLPLDGLLYFVIHRQMYGRQQMTVPGGGTQLHEITGDTSLPLARREEHGQEWYYAASFAQWPREFAEGTDAWSSRLAMGRLQYLDTEKKGAVDLGAGRYKGYRMPLFYRHALYVDWYAVGEPERIQSLLSFATHLGKKTDQGWGQVLRWQIEQWHSDWSVHGGGGELMRAIPAAEGVLHGFRPSYWAPGNQTTCRLPDQL